MTRTPTGRATDILVPGEVPHWLAELVVAAETRNHDQPLTWSRDARSPGGPKVSSRTHTGLTIMEIKLQAKNLELNAQAEAYVQKKFRKLNRHLRAISDAKLELSRTSARSQSDRVVAQMTIVASGRTLRAQEKGLNLFAAIDAVTDVMDRQIQRFKGKFYRSAQSKRSARTSLALEGGPQAQQETEGDTQDIIALPQGKVVRTKRFPIKPMSTEDAVLEMELLSHNFFLFYNIDTNEYNVVYRRHDGDYGVIQPEPA